VVAPQSKNAHKLPQKRTSQYSPIRGQMAYFDVFRSKNILTKMVGYQQRTCLCIKKEFFHVNYIHFRGAVFVHVGQAQLCTGNGVSFYMRSAVEVAWLAHNVRHSSTRV